MAISNTVQQLLARVPRGDKDRLFTGLLDAGLATSLDGECIGSVEDYRLVIGDLAETVCPALRSANVELREGEPRQITLRLGDREATTDLEVISDYIDTDHLLPALNRALPTDGPRLFKVWDAELFGQDFGIAHVTQDDRDALWAHGLPIAEGPGGYLLPAAPAGGLYAGKPAIGFDDDTIELRALVRELCDITDGYLQPDRVHVENETLRVDMPDRAPVEISTDATDFTFAEYPAGTLVDTLSLALERAGSDRVFCTLFGPRPGTWYVLFVTPKERDELIDEYN
jgi:hypothetical protein